MNILQKYIIEAKLNPTELAAKVDLPVPTISRYLNSKFNPRPSHARKIADATGLDFETILFLKTKGQGAAHP